MIPVMAETDVLVVGSGPGGLAAAMAARREGMETMLVERYGCFGGNITQASVESIAWYRHEGTIESRGIGFEFEQRAKQMGASRKEPQSKSEALDTEMFKYIADRIVEQEGITPMLHCLGVKALMHGNTISGIITESKSGRQAIVAKRVIDASGDADIAFRAGAPCHMAKRQDLMGVTVTFSCSGINRGQFLEYVKMNPARLKNWPEKTGEKEARLFSPYLSEPFSKAKEAGEIPDDVEIAGTWSSLSEHGDATYLNMVYIKGVDSTDVHDLTRAEMEGRKQALWAMAALKKYTPGFENAKLRTFCSSVGIRESRKIIGRRNITGHDVMNQAQFDDSIGIFPEFLDGCGMVIIPTTGRYFQVPYGIMIPQKVDNLLVAGRCVAGDQMSHAAIRQMMCCTVTGQGAGVAAAVSIRQNKTCREVDIRRVQDTLEKKGVRIA